jgi:hypothetical protein
MGGRSTDAQLNLQEHALADWEVMADALSMALGRKRIRTVDESRRTMEDLPPDEYLKLSYYERWIRGIEQSLVERKLLSKEEIDRRMTELEQTWDVS